MVKTRTFIHIVGDDSNFSNIPAKGSLISISQPGAKGDLEAVRQSEMVADDPEMWNDYWRIARLATGNSLNTPTKKMKYLKKNLEPYDGDGSTFLFELLPGKTQLRSVV